MDFSWKCVLTQWSQLWMQKEAVRETGEWQLATLHVSENESWEVTSGALLAFEKQATGTPAGKLSPFPSVHSSAYS